jgi:dihydropyrimidinase
VLSPPLREKSDQAALWAGLADGRIDTLGTDHCPFDFKGQKTLGRGDFSKIPNGLRAWRSAWRWPTRRAWSAGRFRWSASWRWRRRIRRRSSACGGARGRSRRGFDADLVVWDPAARRTISQKTQSLDMDYNPYEGFEVRGAPEVVTVRGEIMVRGGKFVGTAGKGRLLL